MTYTKSRIAIASALAVIITYSSSRAVTFEMVNVGNPGNGADSTGHGAVPYSYRIASHEVTNGQYVEFLNSVDPGGTNVLRLYDPPMTSEPRGGINFENSNPIGAKYQVKDSRAQNPVIYVSWYSAIRFANWLHNGQNPGFTEVGAYTLGPLDNVAAPIKGSSIVRNPGAKWWLPSEDEWYKAAFHKNDGATANYWLYPTKTNVRPYSDQPPGSGAPDPTNTANYIFNDGVANGYDDGYAVTGMASFQDLQNYLTNVGVYGASISPYGTFDQAGNVTEWVETLQDGFYRRYRGTSWSDHNQTSDHWVATDPSRTQNIVGFRVATLIPEPATIHLIAFALGTMISLARTNRGRAPGATAGLSSSALLDDPFGD